ncbi:hypothetical protein BH11PSE10_BH11PSE10_10550 [soil metagenome]
MRYNTLGQTGLFVSELALGTMTFGGSGPYAAMGNVRQPEADALVSQALAAGINLIDTADTYFGGDAEHIVGQALKNLAVPRDEVLIATKVFGDVTSTGPNARGNSRAHLLDGVKASLQRLQLDHIDPYQLHGFDPAKPVLETLRALNDLVRQGLLHQPQVTSVTLGARNAAQLSDNLGAAAIELSADDMQQLDTASALPPEYPGWMLAMWSQARAQQLADAAR